MDGAILDQPLPQPGLESMDPFLLIHHWDKPLKGHQQQKETGVGPHPHRGFSPVTLIFKGSVQHRDSRGNNSVVEEGGAQWMNAGMGIIHSERPSHQFAKTGGPFEIIQFWVNTPASYKMNQPEYFPIEQADMPVYKSNDEKITISILTGELDGVVGPIKTFSKQIIGIIKGSEEGSTTLTIPKSYNALIYVLDGKLLLNNSMTIGDKQLALFKDNGDEIIIEALQECRALLLSGEPLGEDVVKSGPFVMNSQTEIMEAMRDYQMGKMGILIEDFNT